MTQGVPQGSVLWQFLWNVLYISVILLDKPKCCNIVAYADELALIVEAYEADKEAQLKHCG